MFRLLALAVSLLMPLFAVVPANVSLKISNEVTPPGGVAQLKVFITEPTPISTGVMEMSYDSAVFGDVLGVALHSPNGDVSGAAVVSSGKVQVRFHSPSGSFGTSADYPVLTVAIAVRPDAPAGSRWTFALDPASWYLDLFGSPYGNEARPGSLTVGQTVSVSNVVPGGGTLLPGQQFQIHGLFFQPGTKFKIDGIEDLTASVISATEIWAAASSAVDLDGARVRIKNPDGSSAVYYSYLRALHQGESAQAWLSSTVALYSRQTYLASAVAAPALALQNPGSRPAQILIERYSVFNQKTGEARISLAAWSEMAREIAELIPAPAKEATAYVRISSDVPVQVLGLAREPATGTALPVAPVPLSSAGL